MKTNMGDLIDTVYKIKDSLVEIEKSIENIDNRLTNLELFKPCDCALSFNEIQINELIWHIQKIIRNMEENK